MSALDRFTPAIGGVGLGGGGGGGNMTNWSVMSMSGRPGIPFFVWRRLVLAQVFSLTRSFLFGAQHQFEWPYKKRW